MAIDVELVFRIRLSDGDAVAAAYKAGEGDVSLGVANLITPSLQDGMEYVERRASFIGFAPDPEPPVSSSSTRQEP